MKGDEGREEYPLQASSINTTLARPSMALASAKSCRSPFDIASSEPVVSSPSLRCSSSQIPTFCSEAMRAPSKCRLVGLRESRTDSSRRRKSCGIVMRRVQIVSRGRVERGRFSMEMLPDCRGRRVRRVRSREDLPLGVVILAAG